MLFRLICVLAVAPLFGGARAQTSPQDLGPLSQAVSTAKPIADLRLRYENVTQDELEDDANALTLRARFGFVTGAVANTTLLVDVEHVEALVEDFNSTLNGQGRFPVVADPEATELNRLHLTNTSLPDTVVTVGRQRIKLDDDRFVGNVGFRQLEQTFDGVRVVNTGIANLKLDVSYITQVNRIFGDDSPMGRFDSQSFLGNASYRFDLFGAAASVTGFAYLLDFEDDAPGASTTTYGVAARYGRGPVSVRGRFAQQSDAGDNPADFTVPYYEVAASLSHKGAWGGVSGTLGYEVLGSDDGQQSFGTPLATLHKFNGFADVFLATPPDGLEDLYGTVSYTQKGVGRADLIKGVVTYHTFSANEGDRDFGGELNAAAIAKFGPTTVMVKVAAYGADGADAFVGDRQKLWAEIGWAY